MIVISIAGFKDSGKTTLCRGLLEILNEKGLATGYIKHTAEVPLSSEKTDTGGVNAGGTDTVLWSDSGFVFESARGSDANPRAVAGRFFPQADIVLMEGGKELALPKVWVLRPGEEAPDYQGIFAVYDRHGSGDGQSRYGGAEVPRLASDLYGLFDRNRRSARVFLGAGELPMKDFVADFVAGGVRGMLSALKNPTEGDVDGDIRVYVKK